MPHQRVYAVGLVMDIEAIYERGGRLIIPITST